LSFYLGYPLRVAVGGVTAAMLQMNGFAVVREGTLLVWNGQQVAVDAPCSGIKMLWTGAFLSCALAAFQQLDTKRTLMLGLLALLIVMAANVLRSTALFYIEVGILREAQPAHAAIGVIMFVFAAVSIALVAARLREPAHAS
jgi:exosortase/archaeosortase family protein